VNGPLGAERGDWAAAVVAQVIAEVNRNPKARSEPWGIMTFLPWKRKPKASRAQTPKEQFELLFAMMPHGGKGKG
jgi:hypothetical protein